jgi:CheY-like chemotaxis protein
MIIPWFDRSFVKFSKKSPSSESEARLMMEKALDKAKLLKPDIVILDLSMPRMGGLEAAPQIRDLLPDACLILFTLYGNQEIERVAKQAGIEDCGSGDLGLTNHRKRRDKQTCARSNRK